jgi:hypothetical protein
MGTTRMDWKSKRIDKRSTKKIDIDNRTRNIPSKEIVVIHVNKELIDIRFANKSGEVN